MLAMGIDLLDIKFSLEREFDISFDRGSIVDLLNNGNTESPPPGAWTDIRVSDLIGLVETTLVGLGRDSTCDVAERTKAQIAESLSISVGDIATDSWLVADLGAE